MTRGEATIGRCMAQVAMVMNLDKCIGCHTCSVTCKQTWTNRSGMEYVWFNNVETRPGLGYPRRYEDQEKWRGGWTLNRRGQLKLQQGGRLFKMASIFANPVLPVIKDYYEPWTYDYRNLTNAPLGDDYPVAEPPQGPRRRPRPGPRRTAPRGGRSGLPGALRTPRPAPRPDRRPLMNTFLWGALPYIVFALLVSGLIWRHRYDKFGWTTRSSEVYESRLLNIASPMFHCGILFVLVGHLMGLFVPESWTDAVGINEHTYHLLSLFGGCAAGFLAIAGILMLLYRRRTNTAVSAPPPATTSSCTWCCSPPSRWA